MNRVSRLGSVLMISCIAVMGCNENKADAGKKKTSKSANPANYVRGALESGDKAKGKLGIVTLERGIKTFQIQEGKNPASLQQLVKKGFVSSVPPAPVGKKYSYNAKTGKVKIVAK